MSKKTFSRTVGLLLFLGLGVCLMPIWGQAQEENTKEKILASFYPYREGLPQVSGITPGMTIDKTNFQVAQEALPSEILKYLQAGDFTITVQQTTDMPLREEYINATLEHHGKVELEDGQLKNYVAGMPFPLIESQEPKAGRKIAWNHRYHDMGDTAQFWSGVDQRNSSGSIERAVSFYAVLLYGLHRPWRDKQYPEWKKDGILQKMYSRMLSPADKEGAQVLNHRYDKDGTADEQWVFDPQTRRIRKIVYNPYEASDGMDFLVEDRAGYMGYIHPYEWKYLGKKIVLAPGPIKKTEATLGGKGNWYPVDPWELRHAIVVEAIPKQSHPLYSRRVLYLDQQTQWVLYGLAYDHKGNHRRTFFLVYWHPEFISSKIPTNVAQSSVDYQSDRAALYQARKVIYNEPLDEKLFNTRTLMRYGK